MRNLVILWTFVFQGVADIHSSTSKQAMLTRRLAKIDKIFLVAFPTIFLLFNVIYWPICLQGVEKSSNNSRV